MRLEVTTEQPCSFHALAVGLNEQAASSSSVCSISSSNDPVDVAGNFCPPHETREHREVGIAGSIPASHYDVGSHPPCRLVGVRSGQADSEPRR